MSEAAVPPKALDWVRDHTERYLATDGADGHIMQFGEGAPIPTLLLTTTGRRSGRKFVMPLLYRRNGDDVIVAASKGGSPQHPLWYLNLVAHPEVDVQILGERFRCRARTTTGEERARLWDQMVEMAPVFAEYEEKAGDREIPIVVLERLD